MKGIVVCGGGYRYFSNFFIQLRTLRVLDCGLPVELWITADEFPSGDIEILNILRNYNARLVSAPVGCSRSRLPSNSRWQWLLKPWSLLHSEFREVIYLDADSFPVRNP